jgi:SAM-dependent methyltransferase
MYKPYVNEIICTDWLNSLHNISFVDFVIDLNEPFPVKKNLFDTILLTDVLEHVKNPDNVWKEMSRILKPGGKIILTVPFFHLLHEEPYDYFRYTEFRLKLYCKENELSIVELYPYGGSLEIFFDFMAKHFSFSKVLSKINYWTGKFLINSFLGKKIYSLTSSKYPLGYCLIAQK